MSENKIIKKYKNEDLTIIWEPKKCIHAAICVQTLPKVYDPDGKPWIQPENANIQELINQIDLCPSGALSYHLEIEEINKNNIMETKVDVMENGPLLVQGTLHIKNANGEVEIKNKTTAFCRCGASANKPYCDGEHKKIDFKG
jgi:uncharacterized Fe-S cluster protein YjdI